MNREVVLTGLRTNAEYHLGNYIGALLPLVSLVEESASAGRYQVNLFAPDLHSFTTPIDFQKLYRQTLDNLKLFAAAGIPLDREEVNLYRQSRIPAHSELTWILSNFAGFGDLSRMIEFKEKAARLPKDQIKAGLFTYPILMAADILLYDALWVPVGEDQKQHLEFCRRLASSFNKRFDAPIFTVPASFEKQQAWLKREEAPRIRSLRQPQQKMSKSVDDPAGTILLSDDEAEVAKKIMAATTDNLASINYDWQKQAGITNLLTILAYLSDQSLTEVSRVWQGGSDYLKLKKEVIAKVWQTLSQLQANWQKISDEVLLKHLEDREARLSRVADLKLQRVQQAIGLRQ